MQNQRIIGIVGGMGPRSGVRLFNEIIDQTRVESEQDHLPIMLVSFPGSISDRTRFLEGRTSVNPAYGILKAISILENSGAEIIGMACNTAYSQDIYELIFAELDKKDSAVRLLHMPKETCEYIKSNFPEVQRIGIMSTNGTYKSGLYEKILLDLGFEVVLPDVSFQNEVIHKMIYDTSFGIKSHSINIQPEVKLLMNAALEYFEERGVDGIVLGCTELSLVADESEYRGIEIFDCTSILAKALIEAAVTKRKQIV